MFSLGFTSLSVWAGDVGTVPKAMAHFVENTGDSPLRFLELFRALRFMDVSLKHWMALTPHGLVQAHLDLDRGLLEALPKEKQPITRRLGLSAGRRHYPLTSAAVAAWPT